MEGVEKGEVVAKDEGDDSTGDVVDRDMAFPKPARPSKAASAAVRPVGVAISSILLRILGDNFGEKLSEP